MIKLVKEYQLEIASMPFEPEDGEVYFVSSGVNPTADHFVEDNYIELREMFAQEGLEFVYVPYPIGKDVNGRDVPPTVLNFATSKETDRGIAFSAYHLDLDKKELEGTLFYQLFEVARAYSRRSPFSSVDYSLDPEARKLRDEMIAIARALKLKGVKLSDLGSVIDIWVEPRGLVVDMDGNLVIPNYSNLLIRLNPLEKALYLLLLQHPEGVEPDALVGFRKDLLRIYRHFTIFGDDAIIENGIDNMLSEDKRALYSHISKLNKKIDNKLAAPLSMPYKIQFRRTPEPGRYIIDVPFDNIRWEQRF